MKNSQLENIMLQFLNQDFVKFTQHDCVNQSDQESATKKSKSLTRFNRIKSFEDGNNQLIARVNKKTQKRQQVKIDTKSVQLSINLTTCQFDLPILKRVMEKNNWKKAVNFDGDILWMGKSFTYDFAMVFLNQTISRIPGMKLLANKRETTLIMQKAQQYFPSVYNFFPLSYTQENFNQNCIQQDKSYIAKPDKGTQGQGIFLLNDMDDLLNKKNYVIQEYINNPLLIDDKKFDLRLYVLVTSLNPLIVYLNEEGLARFCTENYQQIDEQNMNNVFMHLTNYSLNKNSDNFVLNQSDYLKINQGTKRTYTSIKKTMQSIGIDVPLLKQKIEQSIVRFMYAMAPFLVLIINKFKLNQLNQLREVYQDKWTQAKCFHLIGFDVLIDSNLKPWILEINANPSLDITTINIINGIKKVENSNLDIFVKTKILEDAFIIATKTSDEQLMIGKGKYCNSYKMIVDGVPPLENLDLFSRLLDLYGQLCGHKYGTLNQLKFSRLGNNPNLISDTLIKTDYDLVYKRVLIKSLQNDMGFNSFIEAIDILAEKLLRKKTTNYTLQKAVTWMVKTALQNRPQTAKK